MKPDNGLALPSALFDVTPVPVPREPKLSGDRRRAQRQAEFLARGQHPLAAALRWSLRLHADAAPVDDREAPGRRCGNCWYRETFRHHNRSYAKCTADDGARVTHGPGTDVRAWWPACRDHSYGEPSLGPDAARCVPGGIA
jgi:hypothetical protein